MPGWAVSCTLWYGLNTLFPPSGLGEVDSEDVFETFDDDSTIHSVDDDKKADAERATPASPTAGGSALGYHRG